MIDEGRGIMVISEKDVLDCGLFFYDRKRDCLRMERVRIHETSGDIYISEKVFNAIWPSIRESILIGIEKGIKYEMIQIPEEERKLKTSELRA